MIIKKINAPEGINPDELGKYMQDGKHAAPGQEHGPKSDPAYAGGLGFIGETWAERMSEMKASVASYKGEADPLQHWVMSWEKGENPTPAQVAEAWQTFLRHQGADDHQLLYTGHIDTANRHSHGMFNRLSPEPNEAGEYRIAWDKGTIVSVSKGQTHINQIESAHVAIAEICHRQGWKPTGDARYEWKDGQAIKIKRQADPDKIRMGQRIEAWEAREGEKHPRRIMAETAVTAIRSASGDKTLAVAALAAAGINYADVDYLDKKGRRHVGGKLSSEAGEVKISSLPKDCHFLSPTAKTKENIPPYAPTVHESQSKVNALSQEVHGKGEQHATKVHEIMQPAPLADVARGILSERKTEAQTLEALAAERIAYTVETGTDRKTGKEYQYGKITRDGEAITLKALGQQDGKSIFTVNGIERGWRAAEHRERQEALRSEALPAIEANAVQGRTAITAALAAQGISLVEIKKSGEDGKEFSYGQLEKNGVSIPLSALGRDDKGHSIYSLGQMDRTELRNAAMPIVAAHADKGRTATAAALAAQGIALVERKEAIEKDGQQTEIRYGQLERNGVTISLRALGERDGKALYSLGSLEKREREIRQDQLRAEAMPVAEAHARQGWDAMVKGLDAKGIKLSEEASIIKDKASGQMKEVTYARLERDGISVSLRSLGEKDGRALFQKRELERRQLATDAAALYDAHNSHAGAENALQAANIKSERIRSTFIDAQGQEKTTTIIRLERDGITASTGLAGREYAAAALDRRYMPEAQARSLYMEARQQRDPVQYLSRKGMTVHDIDRIGRTGEKVEKTIPKSAPPAAPVQSGGSVIPRNVREMMDQIAESAEQAAKLAQANARASRAEGEKRRAEKALAALQAQVKVEEKKQAQPTPARPAPAQAVDKPAPVAEPKAETTMKDTSQEQAQEQAREQKAKAEAERHRQQLEQDRERERIQRQERERQQRERDRMQQERDRERERERQQRERDRERERQRIQRERDRARDRR